MPCWKRGGGGAARALGDADFEAIVSQSLGSLNGTQGLRDRVRAELGRQLAHGLHIGLLCPLSQATQLHIFDHLLS